MAFPETWGPYFLASIQRRGSSAQSELQIASMIDPTSLEINPGARPVNLVPNAAGGGVYSQEPEEMGEVTFDIISTVELDSTSAAGLIQQFVGVSGTSDPNAYDTSEPLATDTSWPASLIPSSISNCRRLNAFTKYSGSLTEGASLPS
ncbi:hypothetical protein LCGC14_2638200, partial [marine sediment metagenome]